MISYVDKCLLIEEDKEKILVVGDLHIGYDESLRRGGILVPNVTLNETINGLEKIVKKVGKLNKVVLLGDVKHSFGTILRSEWKNITELFDYLLTFSDEIILIKGNHDVVVSPVAHTRRIEVRDYFLWKSYAFLHGDRNFKEIYNKNIKRWVLGHAHPAVWLREGAKKEKYKCFLVGKYKSKQIIVLPSFFAGNEGTDPRDGEMNLAWKFDFSNFEVVIVSEELEVLNFGKLKKLPK